MTDHQTIEEVQGYARAAQRAGLADRAMSLLARDELGPTEGGGKDPTDAEALKIKGELGEGRAPKGAHMGLRHSRKLSAWQPLDLCEGGGGRDRLNGGRSYRNRRRV